MEKNQAQIGQACEPARETEVQQYQHTLGCSLDELSDRLQNLENRLGPVLKCSCPPPMADKSEVEQELVPIANTVRCHNNICSGMIQKVASILDRLEI